MEKEERGSGSIEGVASPWSTNVSFDRDKLVGLIQEERESHAREKRQLLAKIEKLKSKKEANSPQLSNQLLSLQNYFVAKISVLGQKVSAWRVLFKQTLVRLYVYRFQAVKLLRNIMKDTSKLLKLLKKREQMGQNQRGGGIGLSRKMSALKTQSEIELWADISVKSLQDKLNVSKMFHQYRDMHNVLMISVDQMRIREERWKQTSHAFSVRNNELTDELSELKTEIQSQKQAYAKLEKRKQIEESLAIHAKNDQQDQQKPHKSPRTRTKKQNNSNTPPTKVTKKQPEPPESNSIPSLLQTRVPIELSSIHEGDEDEGAHDRTQSENKSTIPQSSGDEEVAVLKATLKSYEKQIKSLELSLVEKDRELDRLRSDRKVTILSELFGRSDPVAKSPRQDNSTRLHPLAPIENEKPFTSPRKSPRKSPYEGLLSPLQPMVPKAGKSSPKHSPRKIRTKLRTGRDVPEVHRSRRKVLKHVSDVNI